jgi:desulfoferrodoxin-like iron-binding protein
MGVKEKGEVWLCKVCGNEVKVTSVGGGTLVCCNKPMELIKEGEPGEEEEEIETEDKEEQKNWNGTEDEDVEGELNKGFAG